MSGTDAVHTLAAPVSGTRCKVKVTLIACTLVFFVISLEAVIVNVARPNIRKELGGVVADL